MNWHELRQQSGLTDAQIAARLSAITGETISRQSVNRWFGADASVPLQWIAPLLTVLGMEVIPAGSLVVHPEHEDYVRSSIKLAQTLAARHCDELFVRQPEVAL